MKYETSGVAFNLVPVVAEGLVDLPTVYTITGYPASEHV